MRRDSRGLAGFTTQRALGMQKQVFHALADPEEPLEVGSSVFYRTAELAANAGLHHLAVDLLVQWRQVEEHRRLHAPSAALGVSVAAEGVVAKAGA